MQYQSIKRLRDRVWKTVKERRVSYNQEACFLQYFKSGIWYLMKTLPQWSFLLKQLDLKSASSSVLDQKSNLKARLKPKRSLQPGKWRNQSRKNSYKARPPLPAMLQIITKGQTLPKSKEIPVRAKAQKRTRSRKRSKTRQPSTQEGAYQSSILSSPPHRPPLIRSPDLSTVESCVGE